MTVEKIFSQKIDYMQKKSIFAARKFKTKKHKKSKK